MPHDEALTQRITDLLAGHPGLEEKRMFGGVGFLLYGNLACGVNRDNLIIRVGPDAYQHALAEAHTGVFDMTGRPMTGWIVVTPAGYESEEDLAAWVRRGVDFALSLPPK